MPAALSLARLLAFSVVSLFSLITLGLAGSLITTTTKFENVYFAYAALGVAVAVLTLFSVPTMLVLDIVRPGGPSSWIITELSILPFLSVLWLATGANTAEMSPALLVIYLGGCTSDAFFGTSLGADTGACQKTSAIEAFAFLNWIILMGYSGMVLVLALIASSRKQVAVWKSSVAELPMGAPGGASHSASVSYGGQQGMQPAAQPAVHGGTSGSVQAGAVHSV
ncbi:hypothetical protein C8J57DRAFT_1347209 [Mycena rebaudengoi]|nr:hypothetical protein C8J57DRAFT_1347209 [Mycena rebaudengoi]